MKKQSDKKYPVIRRGTTGHWHAYGNGWAVCASSREVVKQKYNEMLAFMNELISRPLQASDILKP